MTTTNTTAIRTSPCIRCDNICMESTTVRASFGSLSDVRTASRSGKVGTAYVARCFADIPFCGACAPPLLVLSLPYSAPVYHAVLMVISNPRANQSCCCTRAVVYTRGGLVYKGRFLYKPIGVLILANVVSASELMRTPRYAIATTTGRPTSGPYLTTCYETTSSTNPKVLVAHASLLSYHCRTSWCASHSPSLCRMAYIP